jgi:hypothetical protein
MLLYNTMKTSFSPLEFLGGRHTHGWWTRWQANEIASRETWKGPWSEDLLAMALLPILSLYSLVIFSFHGLITCPSINPKPNTITGRGLEIDATSLSFSGRSNHLPILIMFWEASVMDHSHALHAMPGLTLLDSCLIFNASWFLKLEPCMSNPPASFGCRRKKHKEKNNTFTCGLGVPVS